MCADIARHNCSPESLAENACQNCALKLPVRIEDLYAEYAINLLAEYFAIIAIANFMNISYMTSYNVISLKIKLEFKVKIKS